MHLILGSVLAVTAVVCWVLRQTYQHVPQRELKRLARHGDEVAQLLYRAAAYGTSLRVLLSAGMVVTGVLALGEFAAAIGLWPACAALGAVIVFGWLLLVPDGELTNSSLWLAKRLAPGIAWLLERLHPVIDRCVRFLHRHREIHVHTGLYEKADLLELLERQKGQPDSRISTDEIVLLQHALTFGDVLVSDVLVPVRAVTMVPVTDMVGPVLMDELSKSGHSHFPVYESRHDNVVGILHLRDLIGAKHGGTVAGIMNRQLTYIHEEFTLYQALQAFLKTKRHLFLVVNSFEELVGILTIEDVLEQVIGKPIMDEFDSYGDIRAVAAEAAQREHEAHKEDEVEPEEQTISAK